MAKPPKKVAGSASTDTPATTRLPEAEPLTNRLQAAGPSTLRLPGDPTPIAHLPNVQVDADLSRPAVIVSDMPQPSVESARNEIAWPRSRYAELAPFGVADSGLFEGPDLRIYAEIGTEGRFQVEQNAQGSTTYLSPSRPGFPGRSWRKSTASHAGVSNALAGNHHRSRPSPPPPHAHPPTLPLN